MMRGIRGKDTKPEIIIRKELFKQGFRYRLHDKKLAGKPDIVLARHRAVIFVHGCFWHGHDECHLFKIPSTRTDFWKSKIERNQLNDNRAMTNLLQSNWRVAVVWECSLKGREKWRLDALAAVLAKWLKSDDPALEIRGFCH